MPDPTCLISNWKLLYRTTPLRDIYNTVANEAAVNSFGEDVKATKAGT